jgi:hypothetical protein
LFSIAVAEPTTVKTVMPKPRHHSTTDDGLSPVSSVPRQGPFLFSQSAEMMFLRGFTARIFLLLFTKQFLCDLIKKRKNEILCDDSGRSLREKE